MKCPKCNNELNPEPNQVTILCGNCKELWTIDFILRYWDHLRAEWEAYNLKYSPYWKK